MGARDTHIPSTVMVAMVVILSLKSRKTEPRTSSQSPAHSLRSSQRFSVAFLTRRGDGADQTPALISLVESRVPLTLKMVPGLRGSRRGGVERYRHSI